MTLFLKFVFALFLAYVILNALIYVFQEQLVFRPSRGQDAITDPHFAPVSATMADGVTLNGIFARGSTRNLILVFHGNAKSPEYRADKYALLLPVADVLITGYRGYGANAGKPSEKAFKADAQDWLNAAIKMGYKPHNIIVYGESLGTATALNVAVTHPELRGLILESPFDNLYAVGRMHYPWSLLTLSMMRNPFIQTDDAPQLKIPTLVQIGTRDIVVPPERTESLLQHVPKTTKVDVVRVDSGHYELLTAGALDTVTAWAARAFAGE